MIGLILFTIVQCTVDTVDPTTYIQINETAINIQSSSAGTSQHQISSLFVYRKGVFQGAFPLPAQVPIVSASEQSEEWLFFAGIARNGILEDPGIYPFFERYASQVNTQVSSEITPLFSYSEQTQFRINETFERNTLFNQDLDQDPDTRIQMVDGDLEGKAGYIELSDSHPIIQVAMQAPLRNFPTDGRPIYVEMHYKNTTNFQVGLIGTDPGLPSFTQFKIGLVPRDNWNKIYINFTPDIQNSQLQMYQLIIQAEHNSEQEKSEIWLDNIKWLHL